VEKPSYCVYLARLLDQQIECLGELQIEPAEPRAEDQIAICAAELFDGRCCRLLYKRLIKLNWQVGRPVAVIESKVKHWLCWKSWACRSCQSLPQHYRWHAQTRALQVDPEQNKPVVVNGLTHFCIGMRWHASRFARSSLHLLKNKTVVFNYPRPTRGDSPLLTISTSSRKSPVRRRSVTTLESSTPTYIRCRKVHNFPAGNLWLFGAWSMVNHLGWKWAIIFRNYIAKPHQKRK